MDADGRYNRNVATGIKDAEKILGEKGPTRVMSWDPEQKGLDDALLALSRKQIKFDHMDLTFGTANELFPLAQATPPNPYKLDGTRANRTNGDAQWQLDYREQLAEKEARIQSIQESSAAAIESQSAPEPVAKSVVEPVAETASNVAPKAQIPPVYQVNQDDLHRITSKASVGEISESDMQEFLQSVSDLTKELRDRVSEFAK